MQGFATIAPSVAFYLLALAAQMSGYTNEGIALALAIIATAFLLIPVWHHRLRWMPIAEKFMPSPYVLQWIGIVTVFVGVAVIAVAMMMQNARTATLVSRSPDLATGLYVGEIRLTFGELEKDRHSEISMRVFNGTGRVVEFVDLAGRIKFNAPNNTDSKFMGELPTPTLRHDTARNVAPLREWFLLLSQRVPAADADKIVAMIAAGTPVMFDLNGLSIRVAEQNASALIEQLPLWGGVSYKKDFGFGRIISVRGDIKSRSAVIVS